MLSSLYKILSLIKVINENIGVNNVCRPKYTTYNVKGNFAKIRTKRLELGKRFFVFHVVN